MINTSGTRYKIVSEADDYWVFEKWQDFLANAGLTSFDDYLALSGKVKSAASVGGEPDNRQTLLIGAGAFGVVLILAGVWMFLRDRNNLDEDDFEDYDDEEAEFETAEEVMDAIIALDDLHRAKKIPDEAYRLRREELKELLKELV